MSLASKVTAPEPRPWLVPVCVTVTLCALFLSIAWANSGPEVIAPRFACEVLP